MQHNQYTHMQHDTIHRHDAECVSRLHIEGQHMSPTDHHPDAVANSHARCNITTPPITPYISIITRKSLRSSSTQQNSGQPLYRSENSSTLGSLRIPYNTVGWRAITCIWPLTARPITLHPAASTIDLYRLNRKDIRLSCSS